MRAATLAILLLAACSRASPAGPGGAGGSGGGGGAGGRTLEVCDNGVDDDGNDQVDCADTACLEDPHCPVCGDGYLDGREACELADLRGQSCASLGFDGGLLLCSMTCQLDTSGCRSHERCDVPGDEDGNGKADCADPACAGYPSCLKLEVKTLKAAADVSTPVKLVLAVSDGAGKPLSGQPVLVTPPPGAFAGPALLTDGIGYASFTLRLGRLSGDATFTASILGTDVSIPITVRAREATAGTVLTVVNATGSSGQDESGPAVGAALGAIVDLQVTSAGELLVAEPCRILRVSTEGVLSRLAGDGSCSGAGDDGSPLTAGISVAALALDRATSILYFADPANRRIGALDPGGSSLRTVATGIEPTSLALQGGVLHASDALGNRVVKVALDTGLVSTEAAAVATPSTECSTSAVLQDCATSGCHVAVDPAGSVFLGGLLCGYGMGDTGVAAHVPGVLRLDAGGQVRVAGSTAGGLVPLATALQFSAVPPLAFDGGGNLFTMIGSQLARIDGVTTGFALLSSTSDPGFGGDDGPVAAATFAGPAAMAFGPGGDLYIADTGNAAVRRVVGLGASAPTEVRITKLSGDAQAVKLAASVPKGLTFQVADAAGHPLASQVTLVSLDPGATVYGEGAPAGATGVARRGLRAGIVPGTESFQAYALGLDGKPVGTPAVFTAVALEPSPGDQVPLVGADGGSARLAAGQVVPGPGSGITPLYGVAASDGSYYLTTQCQVLRLRPDGGLVLFAGAPSLCDGSGDGGPAIQAGVVAYSLALDEKAGQLYVASQGVVRAIDLASGIISTVAGGGATRPAPGGRARDAYFWGIYGIASDGKGKLYIADYSVPLVRLDLASGNFDSFLAAGPCPGSTSMGGAMSVAVSGDDVYVTSFTCNGYFEGQLQPDGTLKQLAAMAGYAIAVDATGAPLFSSYGDVYRYDATTGRSNLLATLPSTVMSLTVTPEGRVAASPNYGPFTVLW